jgi:hypothetical protein
MNAEEREHLVRTWIEHHRRRREQGEPPEDTFWSWEKLDDAVRRQPDLAWELILQILETDQSSVTLENLAAGHLEDLFVRHGDSYIERIENQAECDSTFNLLLGGVWKNAMSDDVWNGVRKIRGEIW